MSNSATSPCATPLIAESGSPLDWASTAGELARADSYWLATRRADGRPHVMPVLAVWADETMHFCTGSASLKARNLREDPACVLTASSGGFDLVLEGDVQQVTDDATLQRVADAYDAKYGWRVTVRDGLFQDTQGAPTAGPPPYTVFAIHPSRAFAFGTDETTMGAPTRWQFE